VRTRDVRFGNLCAGRGFGKSDEEGEEEGEDDKDVYGEMVVDVC